MSNSLTRRRAGRRQLQCCCCLTDATVGVSAPARDRTQQPAAAAIFARRPPPVDVAAIRAIAMLYDFSAPMTTELLF
ncbi:hypothetical protein C7450_101151 [Chelatococcus asaccharovorans]|uniref:Uncharacterized protein n=1 Tax=Chelatococcus asaccharovorans TaxID=28210 RepID=A0A2V3UGY3_9HYPH|nr:hypothetical protein C7450_101151 [Chelatococcus asaccharovorans]